MSLYGGWKTALIDQSVDDDLSAAVDLQLSWDFLDITIPTITSAQISVQVSPTSDGTYQDLGDGVSTATTTGGYSTTFKLGGWQHIKIKSSAAQAADRTFNIRGWRF